MPMVAAGLILDDPTLQPVRRLVSLVGTVCVWGFVLVFFSAVPLEWLWWLLPACPSWPLRLHGRHLLVGISSGYGA